MNKKLIVLEGPDGVGKSTQIELLAKRYNAKVIVQPSKDNCVAFIRDMAKHAEDLGPFERQLLIAVSHTVDAFTKFKGDDNIVMDRSYLSGLVYGGLTGLNQQQVAILSQVLTNVYKAGIGDGWDVTLAFFVPPSRYNEAAKDIFESKIKWSDLREQYLALYDYFSRSSLRAFSSNENMIKVESGTVTDVFNSLVKAIDGVPGRET